MNNKYFLITILLISSSIFSCAIVSAQPPSAVYQEYLQKVEEAKSFKQIKRYFSKEALKKIQGAQMEQKMLNIAKTDLKKDLVIIDEKISQDEAFLTLTPEGSKKGMDISHTKGPMETFSFIITVHMKKEDGVWKIVKEHEKHSHVFKKPSTPHEYKKYEERLEGVVEDISLENSLLDVDGWTINVNRHTRFEGVNSFQDIKVGEKVFIIYYTNEQGRNVAKLISNKPL